MSNQRIVRVSVEELEHVERILSSPAGPSPLVLQGQELLKRLTWRYRCENPMPLAVH